MDDVSVGAMGFDDVCVSARESGMRLLGPEIDAIVDPWVSCMQ